MTEKGVSLVETILVVLAIGFIVILMANIPNALSLITKSRHISLAKEIAAKQIEDERSISYINLANGTTAIVDSRLNILPEGSGKILVEDCSSSICTNSEHVKQITITVNWRDVNKDQTITLKTLIGEGGLNQ